jgi:hypothetical protein
LRHYIAYSSDKNIFFFSSNLYSATILGLMFRLSTIVLALFIFSCSAAPMSPILSVEYISPETQAIDDISATTKSFIVSFADDQHSRERAELFLRDYAGGFEYVENQGPSLTSVFSNKSATGAAYSYEIERTMLQDGYQYVIICAPRGDVASQELADRNARNVARFIRDGHLEVSLLGR